MNVTFNNHGITAVIDESVIDITEMHNDDPNGDDSASRFRNSIRNAMFLFDDPGYSNLLDTTTFTVSCGSVTVPNEAITASGFTNAKIQELLDEISDSLVARYPAS